MASLFGNMVKENTDISDEILTTAMLGTSKATAIAYFNAAMASTTQELRALLAANLQQVMNGYSFLYELAIKNGWEKPYDSPSQQIGEIYNHTMIAVQ